MRERSSAQNRRHQPACVLWLVIVLLLTTTNLPAAESVQCESGVEIRLSSSAASQGSLLLAEVRSQQPIAELKAGWAGQRLYFWPEINSAPTYRALLGVDLEKSPGSFPLTLSATLDGGQQVACTASLEIQEGEFAIERLRVARRFVELSPKDLERSRRETQRLLEIFGSLSPERLWRGPFQEPLEEADPSGNFGRRRVLNDEPRSPHSGEDFSAPAGTPVRASQRGRVVLADNLFFAGNAVVLDHGLGLYTFYGHLKSIAVEEGHLVEAGELVGRVGATGRVTGAHLHWAVRLNGARINPLDLLAVLSE